MKIDSLKELSTTFLVNNTISVPKDANNSDYKDIQKYISSGGSYAAYDPLSDRKAEKIIICQNYLESTDWQASAFIKYGRPVDANVSNNCLKAKQWKDDIEACTTIEQLENININFE